ncbi:ankyrin repeat-containing protein NPR4-like isoform X2 [Alnus glutinosa]|nr:ankyrin repeat-containing protein NPR4-like isoform X2 [Alnus glutinosa]
MKVEEYAINMPHGGRQANEGIARSETFRRHTQRSSSGNAIHQQRSPSTKVDSPGTSSTLRSTASSNAIHQEGSSSVPSFPGQPSYSDDAGDSGSHSIMIGNLDPTNGRERTSDDYRDLCVPLLQAAIKGNWRAAQAFLEKHHFYEEIGRARITKEEATALHISAAAEHTTFVKKLLKLMSPDDLVLKTDYGFTALHSVAQVGNVRIAKQLVEMNRGPLLICDANEDTPLIVAAYQGHTDMVSYLFTQTDLEQLTDLKRIELLEYTIYNDMYDTALKILEKCPNIATAGTECWRVALEMLARKPFAIGSESQLSFWKSLVNSWFKGICNKALMKTLAHQLVDKLWKNVGIPDNSFSSNLVHNKIALMIEAAKVGNADFLIILARSCPDLIWQQDENQMSIFHIAILYRHESVFNLIHEIGSGKDSLASYITLETGENMLHLAAKLSPSNQLNINVSGAALQMQRELLWFKEIEKIVPWHYVNKRNSNSQTPKEIFIKAHKDLQLDGEKWMKDTANYCMLVATLIATVIFAAIFTVPGGSNQETGTPIFLRRNWFMVFFISDAIALCSSSTSIVIFLSILTSRYTEEDFFKSLPSKLVFGLVTLFISMAGMMVAFSATCFLVYSSVKAWVPFVVITLVGIPVVLFVWLHHELWVDTFLSTYKSRFLFRPSKRRLF